MEELSALILQAQTGDRARYDRIVRRFQDMAVGYSYAILGDFALAEDAAQEAFLEAYFALPKLREPAAFASWFRKIVYQRCDRLTRGKRLTLVSLEVADRLTSPQSDPACALERREAQAEVHAAIQNLSEKERVVVTLFYMGAYSHQEIATFLELPVSTIKARLHSARARLKERMLDMVKDNLQDQRPSRDDAFATAVSEMLQAASKGDTPKVETLLAQDARLAGSHDDPPNGHVQVTPLHYAAEEGHIATAEALLKSGADVNAVEETHGLTPLGWATIFPKRRLEMAELLLAHGATLDAFTATALGRKEVVEAAVTADPTLLKKRLSLNDNEMQLLHLAVWKGQAEVVKFLLEQGADTAATTHSGDTPLAVAERMGYTDIAEMLLHHKLSS